MLGEHGLREDTPEARAELERRLEAKLRRETPLPLKGIAQRLRMGTWKSARTRVYYWRQPAVNASEETDVLML